MGQRLFMADPVWYWIKTRKQAVSDRVHRDWYYCGECQALRYYPLKENESCGRALEGGGEL